MKQKTDDIAISNYYLTSTVNWSFLNLNDSKYLDFCINGGYNYILPGNFDNYTKQYSRIISIGLLIKLGYLKLLKYDKQYGDFSGMYFSIGMTAYGWIRFVNDKSGLKTFSMYSEL